MYDARATDLLRFAIAFGAPVSQQRELQRMAQHGNWVSAMPREFAEDRTLIRVENLEYGAIGFPRVHHVVSIRGGLRMQFIHPKRGTPMTLRLMPYDDRRINEEDRSTALA